jgi:hypothetical protein
MQNYMCAQIKKIDIDKWYEGCCIKRDPGQVFVMTWIKNNAARFRKAWEYSLCKKCYFVDECGYKVKQDCKIFCMFNKDKQSILTKDV